jgi:hypothetical protein
LLADRISVHYNTRSAAIKTAPKRLVLSFVIICAPAVATTLGAVVEDDLVTVPTLPPVDELVVPVLATEDTETEAEPDDECECAS